MLFLKLQKITSEDNFETSPAKVTGTTDKEIEIGAKILLFTCDDEICHEIEKNIRRKVQITFSEDRLISFEDIQQ